MLFLAAEITPGRHWLIKSTAQLGSGRTPLVVGEVHAHPEGYLAANLDGTRQGFGATPTAAVEDLQRVVTGQRDPDWSRPTTTTT